MPESFAHERCLDHLMRNFSAKLLADGEAKSWAKLSKQISRNHRPTRLARPTRPTLLSAKREAQRPLGGAASPLPDSPPYGQRGRCPSHEAKSRAKFLGDGVAKFCAKLSKQILGNHCPTRLARPTRPTSPSPKREALRNGFVCTVSWSTCRCCFRFSCQRSIVAVPLAPRRVWGGFLESK